MRFDKKISGYLLIGLGVLVAIAPGITLGESVFRYIAQYGSALILVLFGLRWAVLDPMQQRADDELEETLRGIPYADGTAPDPARQTRAEEKPPEDTEQPARVSETASIEEKMAARAERVRRAKEQGKL